MASRGEQLDRCCWSHHSLPTATASSCFGRENTKFSRKIPAARVPWPGWFHPAGGVKRGREEWVKGRVEKSAADDKKFILTGETSG